MFFISELKLAFHFEFQTAQNWRADNVHVLVRFQIYDTVHLECNDERYILYSEQWQPPSRNKLIHVSSIYSFYDEHFLIQHGIIKAGDQFGNNGEHVRMSRPYVFSISFIYIIYS